MNSNNGKSLENWIWDAACSIRGAKDAAKYKEFILPLIFTRRLCDVFDDEVNCIAQEFESRVKALVHGLTVVTLNLEKTERSVAVCINTWNR